MKNLRACEESTPAVAAEAAPRRIGGLAGWLLERLGSRARRRPALVLLERITLAPRQTVSLIEADGRRLLLATSPEGAPAFYALEESRGARSQARRNRIARSPW